MVRSPKIFLFKSNSVKYFVPSVISKGQDYTLKPQANVVVININSAYKQDFTDMFIIGMVAGDFDFFEENCWLSAAVIDGINNRTMIRLNSGDPAVECSHNLLLTSQEKKCLQRTTSEILCKKWRLTLSRATKNYFGNSLEPEPAVGTLFKGSSGAHTLIHFSDDSLSREDIESIEKCAISHTAGYDLSGGYTRLLSCH
jgi:hypothetical protein